MARLLLPDPDLPPLPLLALCPKWDYAMSHMNHWVREAIVQATVEQVYEQLGGEKAIGAAVHSECEMEHLLREGLPVSVLGKFRENWGLTVMELASSLSIPKSTLMRTLERRKRMASGDSDRVYRLASILALAEEYIGDRKKAQLWLKQPNRALGDETPLRALETEIGARRVEQILGRIAYGGVS
jgi:putative toxin-antitoxin system antitoxin component (TIGR02293 family)